MIFLKELTLYAGSKLILDQAEVTLKPQERVGLVGRNGVGKTTFLKLLLGSSSPDSGEVSRPKNISIGYLSQDSLSIDLNQSVLMGALEGLDEIVSLEKKLESLLEEMNSNPNDYKIQDRYFEVLDQFESKGGYQIRPKAEKVLLGLGFNVSELDKPIKTFSGGWRMRVILSRIILNSPDLLLLDEPTNHLDLPSIKWLEEYLSDYNGCLVVVSHDRSFLDGISNVTLEIENKKIIRYSGNYSKYEIEKSLRYEFYVREYKNQEALIKRTNDFITKFKSKSSHAKQVQSRMKMLENLDRIPEPVSFHKKMKLTFPVLTEPGKRILSCTDISKSYGEKVIFKNSNLQVNKGDKVALVGANGIGKSTLLNVIEGLTDFSGCVKYGTNVKTSFFAQHQFSQLDLRNTILEEVRSITGEYSELELRKILGGLLFSGDDVDKEIRVLSGGEKARVALAKVLLSGANFLLLDEPTNHLDLFSIEILADALVEYPGSFVIVSHDRQFISKVATKIWYFKEKHIFEYPGNYSEYEYSMSSQLQI